MASVGAPQSSIARWGWIAGIALVALSAWWWAPPVIVAIGRWQRAALGSAFPATTALLIAALLVLPAVWFGPRQRDGAEGDGAVPAKTSLRLRVLVALGTVLVFAALFSLVPLLHAPPAGAERAVDLSHALAIEPGPVAVTGFRPAAGELRQVAGAIGGGHAVRYLPVVAANAPAGTQARVVAELADDGLAFDPQLLPATIHGIAVANALPAAVADELRRRDALAAGDTMVILSDPAELTRPARQIAAQLALAAVVVIAFAGLEWRHLRRGKAKPTARTLG